MGSYDKAAEAFSRAGEIEQGNIHALFGQVNALTVVLLC